MNLLILGAIAGGVSGATGYFMAGKVHGLDKGEKIYPAYAITLFAVIVLVAKYTLSIKA